MAFSAIFLKLVYIFLYEQNKFPMKGFFIVSQSAEEDKISIKFRDPFHDQRIGERKSEAICR